MKKTQGFTLVEIMIVVAIIGILAAIAIPNFVKNRDDANTRACISNMRQIETAAENYRTANNMATPTLAALVGGTTYIKVTPTCKAGGTYAIAVNEADESLNVTCTKSDKGHVLYPAQ